MYDDFGLSFLPVSFFDTYSLPVTDVLAMGVGGVIVADEARYRERRESPGVFAAIPSLLRYALVPRCGCEWLSRHVCPAACSALHHGWFTYAIHALNLDRADRGIMLNRGCRSLNSGGSRVAGALTDGYRGQEGGVAGYLPSGYSYAQWENDVRRWEQETGMSYEQYTRMMGGQQQPRQLGGTVGAPRALPAPDATGGRFGAAPNPQQQPGAGYGGGTAYGAPRQQQGAQGYGYPPQQQGPGAGAAAGYGGGYGAQQQQYGGGAAAGIGGGYGSPPLQQQQQQQPRRGVDPRARTDVRGGGGGGGGGVAAGWGSGGVQGGAGVPPAPQQQWGAPPQQRAGSQPPPPPPQQQQQRPLPPQQAAMGYSAAGYSPTGPPPQQQAAPTQGAPQSQAGAANAAVRPPQPQQVQGGAGKPAATAAAPAAGEAEQQRTGGSAAPGAPASGRQQSGR